MHSLCKKIRIASVAALLLCHGALAAGELRLAAHADDSLHTVINQPLSQPLVVRVTDAEGNAVPGVAVEFRTRIGMTEPAGATVYSDAQGLARFQPVSRRFGATHVLARSGHSPLPVMFRRVTTGWMSTLVGDGVQAFGGNGGPAAQAQINAPFGMALRGDDLLLVDYFNHALRRIDLTAGTIYPLAGTARQGFSPDGTLALDADLNDPFGIALLPGGEVVFSDYYNSLIRKVDGASGELVTLAGSGARGYAGDGGPALDASLDVPLSIAADSRGNIYMSDWHHHVVRRLDVATGRIDTVAGTGRPGYSGDGPASRMRLNLPLGISVGEDDNLYIADFGNHRVRRLDVRSGELITVAGSGVEGFAGDGGPALRARLNNPYNVYADGEGGLFISDGINHRIRHVDLASGVIETIAGNGEFTYSGDSALAVFEGLRGGLNVITDAQQNLYIAEYFGHRVRRIGGEPLPAAEPESADRQLMRQARQVFGELPAEAVSAANPVTDEKAALGRALFHDPRLSADGTVSCASCHPLERYGVDGLAVARGIRGLEGTRNTPSVFNAALQASQFWDGRTPTVEAQARDPLLHPLEMAMPDEAAVVAAVRAVPAYRDQFAAAFPGDDPVSFRNLTLALGAFQRRLLTPGAPIDRFIAGDAQALAADQKNGLSVFLREGCASCHSGPLLGGNDILLMYNYPDTQDGDQYEFRKQLGNDHKFKVSPLRNIATSAPYLHDGRYRTLRESIESRLDAYQVREGGLEDHVEFTEDDIRDLLAFFDALTGRIDSDYIRPPQLAGVARQGPGVAP